MPAGDPLPKDLSHIPFPLAEGGWKLDARVEEAVVYCPQLDADSQGPDFAFCRPEPRHARYHMGLSNLRRDIAWSIPEFPPDPIEIDRPVHVEIGHDLVKQACDVSNLVGDNTTKDSNLQQSHENVARLGGAHTRCDWKACDVPVLMDHRRVDSEISARKARQPSRDEVDLRARVLERTVCIGGRPPRG